ncbi:MAG: phospholipid scramblase-related protein [Bdellovibrionota bacterium]|jgi:uncharacterized protein YxjI|nr:phospholipid scramblase-related protein [Bdellovibrionota bacterium]
MNSELRQLLDQTSQVFIQQVKEWGEILVGFESSNRYELLDGQGQKIGYMAEQGGGLFGFIKRQIFRSHRPLEVKIWDNQGLELLQLHRPFFFFFSSLVVQTAQGKVLGSVERRFGILYKKYDLVDAKGNIFARVQAPIWHLWTFPILDHRDQEIGVVKKSWGGLIKEIFTDADKFGVKLPDLEAEKKAIALAGAITIDLDFFEDNQKD